MPNYDVAVLGAGFGGLCIAAFLSRAGKKVVLADPAGRAGGAVAAFEKDGFRFSAGPLAVYGLEEGGPLRTVCAAAGMEGMPALRPARYQVVLPDRRITVAPELEEYLEELRREFPREIDRLVTLHSAAGKIARRCASSRLSSAVAARRSARAFLRAYGFSRELTAFFSVRAKYFFGQDLDALPLLSLVHLLSTGPVEFPGVYSRIVEHLASRFLERGGTVLWNEPWPELLYRGRKASGIRTSKGTLESRTVVVNAGGTILEQSVFLGVREAIIPVRMENTVLCLSDYQSTGEWYSLSVTPGGMHAPDGMRAVIATFPVLDGRVQASEELLRRVETVMPFLTDFIVTAERRDGSERCFLLPDRIAPQRRGMRIQGPAPATTGLKNVLVMPDSTSSLSAAVHGALQTAARLS